MTFTFHYYCECCGEDFHTYEEIKKHMEKHIKLAISSDDVQTGFSEDDKKTIQKVVDGVVKAMKRSG